jgi:signal transduction histidine kinase
MIPPFQGSGFSLAKNRGLFPSGTPGMGLTNICERCALVGGHATFIPASTGFTTTMVFNLKDA